MAWLHDVNKLTHLRLKPSNILFFSHGSHTWKSKVADYDLGFVSDDIVPGKYSHAQYSAQAISADSKKIPDEDSRKAADVWSFGMLMYTLFTYKEPFANPEDKKKKATDVKELSKLFENIHSPALQDFLLNCCKPENRLSFGQIVKISEKDDFFPQILKELDLTETVINKIWELAVKFPLEVVSKDTFKFKDFYEFLVKFLILEDKPEEAHYLKQALRLTYFIKASEKDPQNIPLENFSIVCKLFKFANENDKEGFVQRIAEVFKADWFYGSVDRMDAQKQLEDLTTKKKCNSMYFIVRYSNSKQFCITFLRKEKDPKGNPWWENAIIDPALAVKDGGYVNYVTNFKPSLLKHEPVPTLAKTFKPYKKEQK